VGKKKIRRFKETRNFPNFIQLQYHELIKGFEYKGNWGAGFFNNKNPIILELGCGKGEYTVNLGRKYPDRNYIGLDIKGARMWRGAKTSNDEGLNNVAFLRTQIEQIEKYFEKDEVSEIWIVFPDPQPRSPKEKKRLTSHEFLKRYKNILKQDGIIHLKTDNEMLYDYTLEVIEEGGHNIVYKTDDLYNSGLQEDVVEVKTFYEQMWLEEGRKIKYIKFKLF
jgi:tRNA (guanine-N7-)-methyltransferase